MKTRRCLSTLLSSSSSYSCCNRLPSIGTFFKPGRNYSITKSDDVKISHIKTHTIGKSPIVKSLWQDRLDVDVAQGPVTEEIHSPDHLIEKDCSDSRVTIKYDFMTDTQLRESYQDSFGEVLFGRLLEDLDALAGNIAFLHCDDNNPNTRALHVVTAAVDTIKMSSIHDSMPVQSDYVLSGQVVWVGRSSMDVLIEVHTNNGQTGYGAGSKEPVLIEPSNTRILSCMFTFVAKDCLTGKSTAINKLSPSTDAEKRLFKERAQEALKRKQKNDVINMDDNRIMSLIERGNAAKDMPALAHPNSVLMSQTAHENTLVMNPQNVNTGGRVFGGYLMHRAYELALATCYTFAGAIPKFKEVGEITFKKPVDIGDLVRLKSRVVYTSDDGNANSFLPTAHIEVECQVVRPEKASSFVSNTFDFIFTFSSPHTTLRKVLPSRREEAEKLVLASSRE